MRRLAHYVQAQTGTISEPRNWRENDLGDSLFYSNRCTEYDPTTYPSRLHHHDYYELILYLEGDIQYVCEDTVYTPRAGDVILIPPKALHMSRLCAEKTTYRRHVFYLYPDALDELGCGALTEGLVGGVFALTVLRTVGDSQRLRRLAEALDGALTERGDPLEAAHAKGLLIEIFYLLNGYRRCAPEDTRALPETVRRVKSYIDGHLTELGSVEELADTLFYSREYLSRLFQRHFHISVSEYIRNRRIALSQTLLAEGLPVLEVCHRVGYESLSAFNRAFRAVLSMTPTQYRQTLP